MIIIELNSNKLEGEILSEIEDLPKLDIVTLNSNKINELAPEIGNLPALTELAITSQYHNAEYILKAIPAELNNLVTLIRLELGSSGVNGNIDLSNLVNLSNFDVSYNTLTGLKVGMSPDNFSGYYDNFSASNTHLYCINVPPNLISNWQNSTYASQYPNTIWSNNCSIFNNVPNNELIALQALYNDTDGPNWTTNTNWEATAPHGETNVSTWHGITTAIINGGKHVKDIYLASNKLEGTLPANLSNLSQVEYLGFNSNKLTGDVPDMTGVSSLQTFYISTNKYHFGDFEDEYLAYQSLETPFTYCYYYNQAQVSENDTATKAFGESITLTVNVRGAFNEYQWFKQGSPISGSNSPSLQISNLTSTDFVYYTCNITSTLVPDMTLTSSYFVVNENVLNHPDYVVLMALFNATDGNSWTTNYNWGVNTSLSQWYGVTLANGRVTQIYLPNNNLDGKLPSELGQLDMLNALYLYANQLNGCFAPELKGLCPHLVTVNIESGNSFEATWSDFCTSDVGICTCSQNLTLQSTADDYSTGIIFKEVDRTNGQIFASNKITGNSKVILKAGGYILLSQGFIVGSGTVFTAENGGCD